MKLDGTSGNIPPKKLQLRDFSKIEKKQANPEVGVHDSAQFDLVTSSFKLLAANNRRAATYEPDRIKTNLNNGYEALVQFKDSDSKTFVLSVRKESEIADYAALHSGAEIDAPTKQLFDDLKSSETKGNKFYFKRGDQHLKTDAAGAALGLKRGSRVVVKRGDGQHETHNDADKALHFLEKTDANAVERREDIEKAREAGLSFNPTVVRDENEAPKSRFQLIQEAFQGSSEFDYDKSLVESLTDTGKLQVSFENDERPMPLPLSLTHEDINLAAKWSDNPTAEIKSFKEDFKALTEKETILMTQTTNGDMKGMILRADDRAAFFQLRQGERVVALDGQGDIHELKSFKDFQTLKTTGRVAPPSAEHFDGSKTDSDNLMMFYHVSPFDPIEKGNYDDLPQRITNVGSSPQLDIVTMRSDLPTKKNLRVDRAQKGSLEKLAEFKELPSMSDPVVLENFVYNTVKSNMGDDKIRFLVGGHGGAEKGLLPDGEHNNSAADEAMSVDKFAGSISNALDRVEKETGTRPKIDNLMLVSCLMGNTSFIHALAQTGDIETLVASPELMAGSNPISTFDYLADPKTSKASGREYAQHLVDEWSEAPASIGGSLDHRHADTIGAYDLSPKKAKRFQKALGGFFEAAVAEPKYAEYFKESISKAPSYGINPIINVMFDVDNRDLLQVLDHANKDARIDSPKLKAAMKELTEATEAQVIDQKVSENYEGRRGPSLYLPLDEWDFNEKMTDTDLLKSVKYKEFMDLIFEAPLQRSVAANMINEVSRISESGVLDQAIEKLMDAAKGKKPETPGENKKAEEIDFGQVSGSEAKPAKQLELDFGEKPIPGLGKFFSDLINANSPEAKELQALQQLEQRTNRPLGQRIFDKVSTVVSAGLGITGGVAGAVIGGGLGAVSGLLAGGLAGWRGVSLAGTHKPASKEEIEILTKVVDKFLEANGLQADKPVDGTQTTGESKSSKEELKSAFESFNAKSAVSEKQGQLELDLSGPKPTAPETEAKDLKLDLSAFDETTPPSEDNELEIDFSKFGSNDDEKFDVGSLDLAPWAELLNGRVARGIAQLLLWPSESFAIKTHETVGRKLGELPGRIVGAATGAISGAVTNALALGGISFVGAGLLGEHVVSGKLDKLRPDDPDKGLNNFTGRFEDKPDA